MISDSNWKVLRSGASFISCAEELGRKGLSKFRPACYLTDEWGCPSGEPIIGIPLTLRILSSPPLKKR